MKTTKLSAETDTWLWVIINPMWGVCVRGWEGPAEASQRGITHDKLDEWSNSKGAKSAYDLQRCLIYTTSATKSISSDKQ